jgi:hypothetical protein
MTICKAYIGTPEVLASKIMADKELEQYPFRAGLAVQVESMCSSYPTDEWRCEVKLNYVSTSDAANITVKQEVGIALA